MKNKTDYARNCQQLDVLIDLLERENKRLKELLEKFQWISCNKRLPEEYCECLVTYRTVYMQEFMDILEYEPSYEFDYEKGRFKGEWLFQTDDERFTDGEVVAWMLLPERYKEKKSNEADRSD